MPTTPRCQTSCGTIRWGNNMYIDLHDVFNSMSTEEIIRFIGFVYSAGVTSVFDDIKEHPDDNALALELILKFGAITFYKEEENGRTEDAGEIDH